ncbi:MAG: diaminopimelate decarboxylase [Chloroflexota bacterium]|nr:diaminopimelate decarboxylase [Chloroflexota bacterium]
MTAASLPRAIGTRQQPWWVRPGLEVQDGRLTVAGQDAETLARVHGTPLFAYDRARFGENIRSLQNALGGAGLPYIVRFALKANREPEILAVLRELGGPGDPDSVGIDACSPGEVLHARVNGWRAGEISFTGTNLSDRDIDDLVTEEVHVNLDAVSQIERFGRRAPGSTVGLRINPDAGAGYHEGLEYSGTRPTKFGIYEDRLHEAVDAARRHRLTIDTIHFHAGSGWLHDGLPKFEAALARAAAMTKGLLADGHPIREVNVGGGLGRPAREDEVGVDIDAYAAVLARHLGPLGVTVGCEPGDFIAKDAAVLLGEVTTVERRGATTFVGLALGWNVNSSYFIYRFAQELVLCRDATAPRTEIVTVAGHINEAGDVFAEDYAMPPVAEGDIVAILNAGGYHQAMSSTHCLRPLAGAVFLDRTTA